ncbi:MAG: hypothetical protein COV70_02090 [Parcubacteria group bacterium CG11_big_fil_rev_8_21_14_0_20_39_22]|nr:MAG: hypothetical protein COV70_02090 [Parcubacteria group bacterium CG11_big_fil_rev_8_21_14_0_20_39_22]
MPSREKVFIFILKAGVAFTFVYAAIGGFMEPVAWIGFFPPFLNDYIPSTTLLTIWGAFEIIIAGWLLFGKKIFIPSLIATLSLAGLIFFNWAGARDIIFRDVGIFATTLALTIRSYKRQM